MYKDDNVDVGWLIVPIDYELHRLAKFNLCTFDDHIFSWRKKRINDTNSSSNDISITIARTMIKYSYGNNDNWNSNNNISKNNNTNNNS